LRRCEGSDEQRLSQLQSQLQCGTNCGSCLPQLKKLVRQQPQLRPVAQPEPV
jgi:assimilatory nitrate reductase catalytic subunit